LQINHLLLSTAISLSYLSNKLADYFCQPPEIRSPCISIHFKPDIFPPYILSIIITNGMVMILIIVD